VSGPQDRPPRRPSDGRPVDEERWRPRPGRRLSRPRVPGETRDPADITEALAAVGGELGFADPRVLVTLTQGWAEVVGETLATHARLRSVRGGVLTIEVDDAPWATQLRYLAGDLRDRVAALVGGDAVREIRVVVAPRSP